MKKDIKKFVLDTLLPYKEDPSLLASNGNGACVYLTSDGHKCAVGKHMREGKWQNVQASFNALCESYKPKEFFTDEAFSYGLTKDQWQKMQDYHDKLALRRDKGSQNGNVELSINDVVHELEQLFGFNLDELRLI